LKGQTFSNLTSEIKNNLCKHVVFCSLKENLSNKRKEKQRSETSQYLLEKESKESLLVVASEYE